VEGEYVCAQSTPALALPVELVVEEVASGCWDSEIVELTTA
jgi:hypothetical protein